MTNINSRINEELKAAFQLLTSDDAAGFSAMLDQIPGLLRCTHFPGIDGWLNGVPAQLKIVEGKSISAIQRNIVSGANDMRKGGYVGDLYIDASQTGVTMQKMTDFFKVGSPVSNILNEGTVTNIYIKTQSGWLNVTRTTVSQKPGG